MYSEEITSIEELKEKIDLAFDKQKH